MMLLCPVVAMLLAVVLLAVVPQYVTARVVLPVPTAVVKTILNPDVLNPFPILHIKLVIDVHELDGMELPPVLCKMLLLIVKNDSPRIVMLCDPE